MIDFDKVENEIVGYKYILKHGISLNDPLAEADHIVCVCDTRDECIEVMKQHIANYEETNNTRTDTCIKAEPYNITRLGTYIRWYDNNGKSWWWIYGIYPIKYINKNTYSR